MVRANDDGFHQLATTNIQYTQTLGHTNTSRQRNLKTRIRCVDDEPQYSNIERKRDSKWMLHTVENYLCYLFIRFDCAVVAGHIVGLGALCAYSLCYKLSFSNTNAVRSLGSRWLQTIFVFDVFVQSQAAYDFFFFFLIVFITHTLFFSRLLLILRTNSCSLLLLYLTPFSIFKSIWISYNVKTLQL